MIEDPLGRGTKPLGSVRGRSHRVPTVSFDLGNGISTGEAQVIAAAALIVVSLLAALSALASFLETRRARKQAVRPAFALDLVSVTELYSEIGIRTSGRGRRWT
jgi:hypothetical protein